MTGIANIVGLTSTRADLQVRASCELETHDGVWTDGSAILPADGLVLRGYWFVVGAWANEGYVGYIHMYDLGRHS